MNQKKLINYNKDVALIVSHADRAGHLAESNLTIIWFCLWCHTGQQCLEPPAVGGLTWKHLQHVNKTEHSADQQTFIFSIWSKKVPHAGVRDAVHLLFSSLCCLLQVFVVTATTYITISPVQINTFASFSNAIISLRLTSPPPPSLLLPLSLFLLCLPLTLLSFRPLLLHLLHLHLHHHLPHPLLF